MVYCLSAVKNTCQMLLTFDFKRMSKPFGGKYAIRVLDCLCKVLAVQGIR